MFVHHGTHVAGTIGAQSQNATGITGIAPKVQLMAVKVLDTWGYGDTVSIIRGINFAKNNGAKVINASIGMVTSEFDSLMYDAIAGFP